MIKSWIIAEIQMLSKSAAAATCVTNLIILFFGPCTFNQFWIQDLVPAVLTLMLGVSLQLIFTWKKWMNVSIVGGDLREPDSLVCSWRYISSQWCPVSGPAPSASRPAERINTWIWIEDELLLVLLVLQRSAARMNNHFRYTKSCTHLLVGPLHLHLPSVFELGSVQLSVLACGLVSALPATAGATKQQGRLWAARREAKESGGPQRRASRTARIAPSFSATKTH